MKTTHQAKECIFVVVFNEKKKRGNLTERGTRGKENCVWGKARGEPCFCSPTWGLKLLSATSVAVQCFWMFSLFLICSCLGSNSDRVLTLNFHGATARGRSNTEDGLASHWWLFCCFSFIRQKCLMMWDCPHKAEWSAGAGIIKDQHTTRVWQSLLCAAELCDTFTLLTLYDPLPLLLSELHLSLLQQV